MTTHPAPRPSAIRPPAQLARIGVGVDPGPGARDAIALAAALGDAGDPDIMLFAVEPELSPVVPYAHLAETHRDAERLLAARRGETTPPARTATTSDLSVAHGLTRLVRRHRRELLVVGPARGGEEGVVALSRTTRPLIDDLPCPLLLALRGMRERRDFSVRRIGVGFDGGAESVAAVAAAATLAGRLGAELILYGVVEDSSSSSSWRSTLGSAGPEIAAEMTDEAARELVDAIEQAICRLAVSAGGDVCEGRAADVLGAMSRQLDLLVLGSRRWGPVARILLGGTGEALVQRSASPLMIVPRPAH